MKTFERWHDAADWCWKNASENCCVRVADWFDAERRAQFGGNVVAILKYESYSRCLFYQGFAEVN